MNADEDAGASSVLKYARAGKFLIAELKQAQGTTPISHPRELFVSAWPEDENVDDFLTALQEWRGQPS